MSLSVDSLLGNTEKPLYDKGTILNKGTKYKSQVESNNNNEDQFLKILMAQLKYQNPMNPLKGNEFVAQMAQFSNVEQLINLNKTMDGYKSLQTNIKNDSEYTQAISLLGKEVTVEKNGQPLKAPVTEVRLSKGTAKVVVAGNEYLLSDIQKVTLS